MSDSRPSFNMTKEQIEYFPIIFTKNIQKFRKNPDNKDEGATFFHLEKIRSTVLDLLVDSNIDKINERLNKTGPIEAAVIQQTIDDIYQIIDNKNLNVKIIKQFLEIVNRITLIQQSKQETYSKREERLLVLDEIDGLKTQNQNLNDISHTHYGSTDSKLKINQNNMIIDLLYNVYELGELLPYIFPKGDNRDESDEHRNNLLKSKERGDNNIDDISFLKDFRRLIKEVFRSN